MLLKIEKNAESAGQAQDQLRSIISLMNLGHKKGDGWVFGEGEIEHAPEIRARLLSPELLELTGRLQAVLKDKDIREADADTVEQLAQILPLICTALSMEGYGSSTGPDSSSAEAGQGDKAPDEESTVSDTNKAPEGSHEATEGDEKVEKKRFPWDQRD